MRTLVIAEAGSCHDGSLVNALRLIDVAKDADADVVKFQFWSSADRMAERRRARPYRDIYARYQLPVEWLEPLKTHADERGIEFGCTVYLPEDVDTVAPFVTRWKVSSFEAQDRELLWALSRHQKFTIISLGMLDHEGLLAVLRQYEGARDYYRLLHCVSAYPAEIADLHLRVIHQYGLDGFSDHSGSTWTGALAVAAGARIVEAHFKLRETSKKNPDAPHALGESWFCCYVNRIRLAEEAVGDGGHKVITEAEKSMLSYRVTA